MAPSLFISLFISRVVTLAHLATPVCWAEPTVDAILAANVSAHERVGAVEGLSTACSLRGHALYAGNSFFMDGYLDLGTTRLLVDAGLNEDVRADWTVRGSELRYSHPGYDAFFTFDPATMIFSGYVLKVRNSGPGKCRLK